MEHHRPHPLFQRGNRRVPLLQLPCQLRRLTLFPATTFPFLITDRTLIRQHRHMSLQLGIRLVPPLDLFDREWLIHTRSEERSPAKSGPDAIFRHSLASHGCIINGTVVNSLLSPGVKVYDGAVVRDSVIMLDAEIGAGAVVDGSIVDKHVTVGAGAIVGHGEDHWVVNAEEPDRLTTGITVIGKRAVIPRGARIGRSGSL